MKPLLDLDRISNSASQKREQGFFNVSTTNGDLSGNDDRTPASWISQLLFSIHIIPLFQRLAKFMSLLRFCSAPEPFGCGNKMCFKGSLDVVGTDLYRKFLTGWLVDWLLGLLCDNISIHVLTFLTFHTACDRWCVFSFQRVENSLTTSQRVPTCLGLRQKLLIESDRSGFHCLVISTYPAIPRLFQQPSPEGVTAEQKLQHLQFLWL